MLTAHGSRTMCFGRFPPARLTFYTKTAEDGEIVSKVLDVYQNKAAIDADIAAPLTKKLRDVMKMQKSLLYTVNQITKLSKSEISVCAAYTTENLTAKSRPSGMWRKGRSGRRHREFCVNLREKSMKSLIKSLKEMELFDLSNLYYAIKSKNAYVF